MAYQLPPEIQHLIWTYLMYNSAKGLGFRKQIQEGWFKLRLRRLSNALETKSQDIYHQELGQLLLSMDELLNLPGEMRLRFHSEMLKIHYSKFHSIDKARVWVVRMKNLTMDKLYSIGTRDTDIKYFLNGIIYDSNKFYGCLYLKEEAPKHQVQWLLSAWNTQDVSLSVASLTAAGINHFITSELIRYINRPDSYNVAIGHYTPRQIEPQIILKFPSRESDYLLNN